MTPKRQSASKGVDDRLYHEQRERRPAMSRVSDSSTYSRMKSNKLARIPLRKFMKEMRRW